jgi:hypothetical protein
MITTPNLGLFVWDLGDDPYDHLQLATNFNAIDQHDHTQSKGRQIPRGGIANSAIDGSKIAVNAVSPSIHIPDKSIPQVKMGDNSVGSAQLIDGSVGSAEIADHAVQSKHLAADIMPLGTVITWYRANTAIPIPTGGWEVCDGRPWASVSNAWGIVAGNMPDSRNRYVLGAALTGTGTGIGDPPGIGALGGQNQINLQHTHTGRPHTHSVPPHTHGINADGSHRHRWITTVWSSGGSPIGSTLTDAMQRGSALPGSLGTREALYVPDLNRNQAFGENVSAPMETIADHSHGGQTQATPTLSTSSDGASTNEALGATDIRPQYIGLLMLMKVRD